MEETPEAQARALLLAPAPKSALSEKVRLDAVLKLSFFKAGLSVLPPLSSPRIALQRRRGSGFGTGPGVHC